MFSTSKGLLASNCGFGEALFFLGFEAALEPPAGGDGCLACLSASRGCLLSLTLGYFGGDLSAWSCYLFFHC